MELDCDYMITVCRDETSTSTTGTDFTLLLHGVIKFDAGNVGEFFTWYLFKFFYILF